MNKISSKKSLRYLLIWVAFHLLALIFSYTKIDFFNGRGKPDYDKFWPFVEYHSTSLNSLGVSMGYSWQEERFNGIFVNYDWTEFAVYTVLGLLVYTLLKLK